MFHSHLKYPVFYLLTEFQSPILKHESQTCCFYILFFLIFKLMFIFRTEFCIRQGFTSNRGWRIPRRYWFRTCSWHIITNPKSTNFFVNFLKGYEKCSSLISSWYQDFLSTQLLSKQQITWVVSLWRSLLTFVWPGIPKDGWLGLIGAPSDGDWNAI